MDILCSDKTGTITKNSIELSHIKPIEDFKEEDLILFSYLCSSKEHYDMIDKAIINFFEKNKDKFKYLSFTIKEFEPFDPSKKYSQSKALINQKEVIIKKGSPSVLLDDKEQKLYEELIKNLASQGLRVLALVVNQDNIKKVVGFLGFSDPPREDSKELITKIKELGVNVKMLTGDTKETAQYIGKLVGIEGKTCDKRSMEEDCDIFANVYPEDKFNIVKFYQSKNHIVGMTGDGVNDAPALKQANLGIAVANATDAAKAAGGIILTQEGLKNILSCIILSRQIYERMLTYVFNKTVKALNTVFIIAIFFIIIKNFILTPTLLVIQFFFNDFITLAIVTDNVHYSKKPSRWKISKLILVSIIFATFVITLTFLLIYFLGIKVYRLNIKELQTYTFLSIVLVGNLSLLVIRERQGFFKTFPSKALSLSIFISIFLSTIMSIFGFLMKALPISIVLYTYCLLLLAYFLYEGLKIITLKHISIS